MTTRRVDTPVTSAPQFNGRAFARWLRRWRDAEGLEWQAIADRSGLSVSTIQGLASGMPASAGRKRGQTDVNPPVNTLARIAVALGLELTYVLSKAGLIDPSDAGRWSNFSNAERITLARALAVIPEQLRTPVETRMLQEVMNTTMHTAMINTHDDDDREV